MAKKLDKFHYFEVMDRSSVVMDHMQDAVGDHLVLKKKKHKRLRKAYRRAEAALAGLYQEAGTLFFKKDGG